MDGYAVIQELARFLTQHDTRVTVSVPGVGGETDVTPFTLIDLVVELRGHMEQRPMIGICLGQPYRVVFIPAKRIQRASRLHLLAPNG
jgi:imidazoleglycerol phosphate synthase glutamine amidotransferase subunit HisH